MHDDSVSSLVHWCSIKALHVFMCVHVCTSMPSSEDSNPRSSSPSSGSHILHASFSAGLRGGIDGDISFKDKCSKVLPFVIMSGNGVLRICSHLLQEEASLNIAEQGGDL